MNDMKSMRGAPVRILHVMYRMGRGGLESRTMDIYRQLNKSKYQFDFYMRSGLPGDFDEEIKDLGGKIFYSKSYKFLNIPDFNNFKKFLKSHPEYKIIFAYNHFSGWFLRIAKKLGVPVRIASARGSLQAESLKNFLRNIVKLPVNFYATHKFAVSKLAGEWLFGKKAVKNGEVEIERNSINTKQFAFSPEVRDKIRAELKLKNDLAIIHVGNFVPVKNHLFLIKVFNEILKLNNNARLLLVGGGDNEPVKALAEELGILDKINFLGVRNDVSRLLQAGDIFIFPSFHEGFPGAVLEAEASGLPCLVSNSVTDEVKLSDNVLMLPLSKGAEFWAQKALEMSSIKIKREDAWREIKNAGYDIHTLIKQKEEFFDKALENYF